MRTERTDPDNVPEVTMQMLSDAGVNPFALQLLSECLAGKADIKTFKPLQFKFKGVIYTFEPEIPI